MPEATSSSAAFIDAIKAGEFERVKAMVSADPALIDAHNRGGESAILTAVYHRQKEIVNKLVAGLLIGRGADVNAADAAGWRPLHLAAANNNLDAIKALVAQGADVAAGNGEGLTPLTIAQEKSHREAAALLRRYGA